LKAYKQRSGKATRIENLGTKKRCQLYAPTDFAAERAQDRMAFGHHSWFGKVTKNRTFVRVGNKSGEIKSDTSHFAS
jgi:hypothetical protein